MVDAVVAALDPGDGVVGVLPGDPLGGRARYSAEGLLGVGEVVGAAVVLDGGGGLSPGPPAPGAVGDRAELAAQVAGLLLLGGHGGGAALPGQLADDLAVGEAEVGVGLQPAGPALLVLAHREFDVGGPVGLLAGQQGRGPVGRGRLGRPAPAKHPPPLRSWPLVAVSCSRVWSASTRRTLARASSRARSRGAWSSRPRSRSRSARSSAVDSRRRSRLLWVSIANLWSPARDRAWASWA